MSKWNDRAFAMAPRRKRPRRVAKKIRKRGGLMRFLPRPTAVAVCFNVTIHEPEREACEDCDGTGSFGRCPSCNGTGDGDCFGDTCSRCAGEGQTDECYWCGGEGLVTKWFEEAPR